MRKGRSAPRKDARRVSATPTLGTGDCNIGEGPNTPLPQRVRPTWIMSAFARRSSVLGHGGQRLFAQVALEDLARGGARQRIGRDANVAGDLEPGQVFAQEGAQRVKVDRGAGEEGR